MVLLLLMSLPISNTKLREDWHPTVSQYFGTPESFVLIRYMYYILSLVTINLHWVIKHFVGGRIKWMPHVWWCLTKSHKKFENKH